MGQLKLCVITPLETFFDSGADMVILRASDGDIGILPGHAPLITVLAPGIMTVIDGKKRLKAHVSGGFAEILPARATVVADGAEWVDNMAYDI